MRILVTGASGFVGRRVVARLCAESAGEVVAASRKADPRWPAAVRHVAVDLLAPGAPAALISRTRPSHLVHLAWNAEPGRFWSAPDNLDWLAASALLLRAFAEAGGAGAVMAGSCAEYDWTGEAPLAEDSVLRPATLYGALKDATARAALAAGGHFGIPVAWGRIFWLYGPDEAPGRLVSDVARALAEGRDVETSAGLQARDFLHVDDAAGAFVAALRGGVSGAFNVGSGAAVPVRRIVEILAGSPERLGRVRFGARPAPAGDPPRIVADTRRLREVIGFTPMWSLDEGLRQTAAWWDARAV